MAKRGRGEIIIPFPQKWAGGFHASLCRWCVMVLHRRAGKTTSIINEHQRAALDNEWEARRLRSLVPSVTDAQLRDLLRGRLYGHVMPTYKQAKLVAWDMLKYYAAGIPGARPNEVDLAITYPTGARLQLFGADNPDALPGGRCRKQKSEGRREGQGVQILLRRAATLRTTSCGRAVPRSAVEERLLNRACGHSRGAHSCGKRSRPRRRPAPNGRRRRQRRR